MCLAAHCREAEEWSGLAHVSDDALKVWQKCLGLLLPAVGGFVVPACKTQPHVRMQSHGTKASDCESGAHAAKSCLALNFVKC